MTMYYKISIFQFMLLFCSGGMFFITIFAVYLLNTWGYDKLISLSILMSGMAFTLVMMPRLLETSDNG